MKFRREVVVGEHVVGQDRDCVYDRTTGKCEDIGLPPAQKRGVERVIIHENWNVSNYKGGSDIALVRVNKPIVMFFVSYILKLYYSIKINISIGLLSIKTD